MKVVFKNARIFTGEVIDIFVEDGKIVNLGKVAPSSNWQVIDLEDNLTVPGGIDPHTHFDDPGFTSREDFLHGSRSAIKGGVTTIVDMPCTSVPAVTSVSNLKVKLEEVSKKSYCDFAFYGGILAHEVTAENDDWAKKAQKLWEYGVLGFKTYTVSGMKEYPSLDNFQFLKVLNFAAKKNVLILVHAEDKSIVDSLTAFNIKKGNNLPIHYFESRPGVAENVSVATISAISKKTGARTHFVHISDADSVLIIDFFKKMGANLSLETCPHFLEFTFEDLVKIGGILKTAPVVKTEADRNKLWDFLKNDKIDYVATDHAPCNHEKEKNTGNIWKDYAGLPGVELLMLYLFSEGVKKGRLSLRQFVKLTSENAAKNLGIYPKKGTIKIGSDCDLCVIDESGTTKISGKDLESKGKYTPFEGRTFNGRILKTIIRGNVVYDSKYGISDEFKGKGSFIKRLYPAS